MTSSRGRTWQHALARRSAAALVLLLAVTSGGALLQYFSAHQRGEDLSPLLMKASEQARLVDHIASLTDRIELTGSICPEGRFCGELAQAAVSLERNREELLRAVEELGSSPAASLGRELLTSGATSVDAETHLLAMHARAVAAGGHVSFRRDEFSGTETALRQNYLMMVDAVASQGGRPSPAALPFLVVHLVSSALAAVLLWLSLIRPLTRRTAEFIQRQEESRQRARLALLDEREKATEQIERMDEAREAFAAPLDAMIGHARKLGETGQAAPETLRTMREASDTLMAVLTDLFGPDQEAAPSGKERAQPVDLQAGIQSLLGSAERLARRKGAVLTVRSEVPADLMVDLPKEEIRRLVTVLIADTLRASGKVKGSLRVQSSETDEHQITLAITFTLEGVSGERAKAETPQTDGVVRRLLQAVGGTLKGLGSGFKLTLPLRKLAGASGSNDRAAQRQVLIVDDVAPNRLQFAAMVEVMGGKAVTEANGVMGVRRALEDVYDIILMDISMPVMDGIEATRTIRSGSGPNASTPIVAVTAHAGSDGGEQLLGRGFDAVVHKPLTGDKLARIMDRFTEAVPADQKKNGGTAC
ncbi:response regulator [Parvularcula maris]|uniref:histidine kinase n=1 Tax=Parvularcula maris TaxID=2965077 RepID=A0A9X2LDI9_9PROT|nr:response regulator [Parvularcula maris]MCQ8186547.1 response regulator [Parvularcula maris]